MLIKKPVACDMDMEWIILRHRQHMRTVSVQDWNRLPIGLDKLTGEAAPFGQSQRFDAKIIDDTHIRRAGPAHKLVAEAVETTAQANARQNRHRIGACWCVERESH